MRSNERAALIGNRHHCLAPVMRIGRACKQAFGFHRLQDTCQRGQQQAGGLRDGGVLHRTAFVQHPQDAPFLFVDPALRQHFANRPHHLFARPQQGDRQGAVCFRVMRGASMGAVLIHARVYRAFGPLRQVWGKSEGPLGEVTLWQITLQVNYYVLRTPKEEARWRI